MNAGPRSSVKPSYPLRSRALAALVAVGAALAAACGGTPEGPTPLPPPPAPVAFGVTGAVATAAPLSAGCGGTQFTFAGTIAANGAGDVRYQWRRSDGAGAPEHSVHFGSAGSQVVSETWNLGAPGSHWMQLVILGPNAAESNRAVITVHCP